MLKAENSMSFEDINSKSFEDINFQNDKHMNILFGMAPTHLSSPKIRKPSMNFYTHMYYVMLHG